jgi:acyl-CoA thioester hydrolase
MSKSEAGLTIRIPVRWGDMDALGHVNNTLFFRYCEQARIAYFEAVGIGALADRPSVGVALVAASLSFRRQLRYPDTVAVTLRITRVGRSSFAHSYELRSESTGELVADGTSTCALADYARNRSVPLPAELLARIAKLEDRPELAHGRGG